VFNRVIKNINCDNRALISERQNNIFHNKNKSVTQYPLICCVRFLIVCLICCISSLLATVLE